MRMRRFFMVTVGATAVAAATFVSLIVSQGQDEPSRASRIPCPSVGPAGQTGEMTCFESRPTPYTSGATMFGPYRLLPAGTKFIERDYGAAPQASDFSEVNDSDAIRKSSLYIRPPLGVAETALRESTLKGTPLQVLSTWELDGKTVNVVVTVDRPEWLPIDVYLHFPDSLIQVRAEMIAGKYAIVMEPATGPAKNIGYVTVWLDGIEVSFSSEGHDHKTLRALAQAIATEKR